MKIYRSCDLQQNQLTLHYFADWYGECNKTDEVQQSPFDPFASIKIPGYQSVALVRGSRSMAQVNLKFPLLTMGRF